MVGVWRRLGTVWAVRSSNYPEAAAETIDAAPRRHRRWIARAVSATRHSRHRTPMAAVAVLGGRIIGEGVNVQKNSPALTPWDRCSRHAEQSLLAVTSDIEGATVYVARVRRNGAEALARPCVYCRQLLEDAGVRQVIYTIEPGVSGIDRLR